MPMSAQKTERLINLTLALLATKKYLTKSEIFSTVAGYTGSPETMERMFERDKDELRELGIEIEVGGLDPLFEDDQGYLIRSESFQLDSNQFENEELLYLTMAVNLWHDSALQTNSKAALLKIQSLSGPIESNSVNLPVIRDTENSKTLATAFESVEKRFVLNFQYKGSERNVQPYGLYTQDGFWYLVANEADAIKSFIALGQESRLNVFRLIVQKGDKGITPTQVKELLGIPSATLSFHLKELIQANLIKVERQSRNLIYKPQADVVQELTDFLLMNCCGGKSCETKAKKKVKS